jgi:ribonuclease Z
MIEVCLLGCGGSLPVPYRSLTALFINYKGKKILVDCGEGTQVSMKILGWGFKAIDIICFTHAHADHIIGLPGILLTIANAERTEPLTIIAPTGFSRILKGLMVVCPYLPFSLNLIEVNEPKSFSFGDITINTLPVEHTISCNAYSFEINRSRKFDIHKAKANLVPITLWNKLQKGDNIDFEGKLYTPDMVLGESRRGLKLSYCTDTRPIPSLVNFIRSSNLFICEGMYGDDAEYDKAVRNKHMLFSEAANLAKASGVKELWLTHFSPSMLDPYKYLNATRKIFSNTSLGEDRLVKSLDFKSNLDMS